MGRPLNRKWFTGDNNLNFSLKAIVRIGGANFTTDIVRQRSNSKYEVRDIAGATLGPGATGLAITSPGGGDVITDGNAEFADFTASGFVVGEFVIIRNAEDPANNGTFELAAVAADSLTLVVDGVLTPNAADSTMTLTPSSGETLVASLVEGAPILDNTMQIVVSINGEADESARIINAHQVKTFEGNTYVWPDVTPAGGNRAGIIEADLQGE